MKTYISHLRKSVFPGICSRAQFPRLGANPSQSLWDPSLCISNIQYISDWRGELQQRYSLGNMEKTGTSHHFIRCSLFSNDYTLCNLPPSHERRLLVCRSLPTAEGCWTWPVLAAQPGSAGMLRLLSWVMLVSTWPRPPPANHIPLIKGRETITLICLVRARM